MIRQFLYTIAIVVALTGGAVTPVWAQDAQPAAVQVARPDPLKQAFAVVNGFFDKLFTAITGRKADPDPTMIGVAPFADADRMQPLTQEQQRKGALARPEVTLDQPHRSSRDLEDWLMDAMADLLSFDADTYPVYVEQLYPRGMSPTGIQELNEWVVGTGILESLRTNGLQLNAFATGRPVLLNEAALSGRYRWLYEIPVLLSFVPKGTTVYEQDLAVNSQKLLVTLQIGRVQDSVLEHNVAIETWSARPAP